MTGLTSGPCWHDPSTVAVPTLEPPGKTEGWHRALVHIQHVSQVLSPPPATRFCLGDTKISLRSQQKQQLLALVSMFLALVSMSR